MNHEPPPESASTAGDDDHVLPVDPQAASDRAIRERRKRNRLLFNKKRESSLKDFLRNVDILIYAELATVYYMDCSFIRFFIRALVQFTFLTPKPPFIPEPPQNRPYVGAIFGSNLLCLVFHVYNDAPAAGEPTRGYLHGGLAMDFIGQRGPTSKLHLVILDVLLLLLQLVALGAHVTRIKVKRQTTTTTTPVATPAAPAPSVQPNQNLDHEERGVHRADHDPVDIELQDLNSAGRQEETPAPAPVAEDEGSGERDSLLPSSDMQPRSDSHIFDAFNTGEIIIADLDLLTLVRTQIIEYQNAPSEAAAATGGTLSERLARGGLGFRLRIGNRVLGV